MKAALLALGVLACISVIAKEPIQLSDEAFVYHAGLHPNLDWYFTRWDQAGYATPKEGESSKWSDFMEVVKYPVPYDVVCYHEKGVEQFAAFVAADDGKKDNHPGVMVIVPMRPGFIFVDIRLIDGFLHPKKLKPKQGDVQI